MKLLNALNKEVTLTEMESQVYEAVKELGEMDDCHATTPESVSDETNIPMKQLRGVISSLSKKEISYTDELVSGCGDWIILYEDK